MSQLTKDDLRRSVPALVAGASSFFALSALFVATMLLHYQAIDFTYLSFALLRITAIAAVVTVLAWVATRYLRSLLLAVLFGLVAGLAGGVALVAAAA